MPRGDQTGPMGQGPRTGRGMGNCAQATTTFEGNRSFRFGQGCGFRSRFFSKNPTHFFNEENYKKNLEIRKQRLTTYLQAIEQELAKMNNTEKQDYLKGDYVCLDLENGDTFVVCPLILPLDHWKKIHLQPR